MHLTMSINLNYTVHVITYNQLKKIRPKKKNLDLAQKYVPSNCLPGLSWKDIYNQKTKNKSQMQRFSAKYSPQIVFKWWPENSKKLAITPKYNFLERFQSKIRLLSRVSCSRLNQGHRYHPFQTFHPGMWTLLQSSSSSTLAHCHWLIHCWHKVCQ